MKILKSLMCSLAACLLIQTSIAAAPESGDQVATVQAQWQAHEVTFNYMGFSTLYSCTGLEDRLKQMLRDLGAKADVRVSATGCYPPREVSKMITARIRVSLPAEAGGSTAEGAPFPAQHKVVTLNTNMDAQFGSGDCELLEQVRDQLVPALKLQVTKNNLHCVPGQATVANQSVQVSALVPVDEKQGKK